jgi:hypothetical protein
VIRIGDLREAGASRAELDATRRDNTRLTRGFYCEPGVQGWRRYEMTCRAVLERLNPSAVLAGPSAAAIWGLPLVGDPPDTVFVKGLTRGEHARDVQLLTGPFDRSVARGLPVTTPAWTVLDCARLFSRRDGLIVADGAAQAGLTTAAELTALLSELQGRKGAGKARWVVANMDGRSESAGETWSRFVVKELGYECTPQYRVADGDRIADIDLLVEPKVGLEFDGMQKYRKKNSKEASVKVAVEKIRRADLEAIGYRMLEVVWLQLQDPARLDRRLQHAGAERVRRPRLTDGIR